ncbi:MAG: hypothetical protein ACI8RN_002802 [Glaciecola sp.]|jgi:hypothetical protein
MEYPRIAMLVATLCLSGGWALQAAGQESVPVTASLQSYPRAYFLPFTPQTAREMLDRLPGFVFDPGTDVRGFGATAGNVLIDGARPSSKSGGLEEALSRIGANIVERIEVIRGSAGAREAAGQGVVANIVTRRIESTRVELALERAAHGKYNTAIDLVYAAGGTVWSTESQFNATVKNRPLKGIRKSLDANAITTLVVAENSPSETEDVGISSRVKRASSSGILTVNGRLYYSPSSATIERIGFDGEAISGDPDQRQIIGVERKRFDSELGIDWTYSLRDAWALKLISLSRYDEFESQSSNGVERPVGTVVAGSLFKRDETTLESILRATVGRSDGRRLRPEFGSELTYNRLDSRVGFQSQAGFGASMLDLPVTTVTVEEIRSEVFANLRWFYSDELRLEAGVAAEGSRISVSGDANNAQAFFFAKPFATLIYDLQPAVQLRIDGRRTVGQLDFSDFAASASLADDRQLDGNPDLGPDQTTRLSASIDLRSDNFGAANLEIFHEWREDVLEQVVLPSGGAGLGNAGSARVWGLRSTASVALSPWIPNGRLELDATLLDATFDDPIIAGQRSVSSIDASDILVEFRQDLLDKRMSWGVSYRPPLQGPFFFVDEISTNRDGRYWGLFAETTRFFGLKMRLNLDGIGKQNFSRRREFFQPDRSGVFRGSELISRDQGMFVRLTFSGQF